VSAPGLPRIIEDRHSDGNIRWIVEAGAPDAPVFSSGPFPTLEKAVCEAALWVRRGPVVIVRLDDEAAA